MGEFFCSWIIRDRMETEIKIRRPAVLMKQFQYEIRKVL